LHTVERVEHNVHVVEVELVAVAREPLGVGVEGENSAADGRLSFIVLSPFVC
jgi:hypothetical protein